ncbi:DUF4245 domain-containing protein [Nocardioides sp. LHG3406-4]|uniref:DUF4245 domain-containing protein n=1 Tax=Nocardioides sp. LHG3406-4 TaxID=2804575 RepID=UPI003CF35CA7
MSEKPGRYQRSAAGMVGALLVTVIAILGFVGLRALNRNDLEASPETVDYLEAVRNLQGAGRQVAYPPSLPGGWRVTSIDSVPGDHPVWGLGMLTDRGDFVGVRQEDESADDLVEAYVDEEATQGDPVSAPGSLAPSWETWTDQGGDVGYAADVDGETVLVYGSAGVDDVRELLERLTQDALAG